MTQRQTYILLLLVLGQIASIFLATLIMDGSNPFGVLGAALIIGGVFWFLTHGLVGEDKGRDDYSDFLRRLDEATRRSRGW